MPLWPAKTTQRVPGLPRMQSETLPQDSRQIFKTTALQARGQIFIEEKGRE